MNNNETTRIINDEPIMTPPPVNPEAHKTPVPGAPGKKGGNGKTVAAVAGGFVAGAAAGGAVGVMASDGKQNTPTGDDAHINPEENEALLVNEEGIRFAHVEADSFEEAFNQAREQVGPGGAFEYEGKIYGTYYKDEWNALSPEERADFQARVTESLPQEEPVQTSPQAATEPQPEVQTNPEPQHETAHQETINPEPADDEVRILGVETIETPEGYQMDVVDIMMGDEEALLVDVDQNGTLDVMVYDENHNGVIEDNEFFDITGENLTMNDLGIDTPHDYMASDEGVADNLDDPNIMPV